MKMNKPELEVVRFGAEDVIATSGAPEYNWSAQSYIASKTDRVTLSNGDYTYYAYFGSVIKGDANNAYNYLDGIPSTNSNGDIFTVGQYYHYDVDSNVTGNSYWNWKTCTDESHHSN